MAPPLTAVQLDKEEDVTVITLEPITKIAPPPDPAEQLVIDDEVIVTSP
jgi:hypothetical protein